MCATTAASKQQVNSRDVVASEDLACSMKDSCGRKGEKMSNLSHMENIEDVFNVRKLISDTLADFDVVASVGAGAILYSKRWSQTGLPRNLHAAAVATSLGLSSIDYAKRRYTADEREADGASAADQFLVATRFARDHMRAARERVTGEDVGATMGAYAARVALQRLESGFEASDLLYRLGFNYEGDAVARQVLEQVAWSLVAGGMDDVEAISRVKAHASVSRLKEMIPWMGELYGQLSATTHAGLAQHLHVHGSKAGAGGHVILAWSRLGTSARLLLLLADAWVVVWERTQWSMMTSFVAFAESDSAKPLPKREFLLSAQELIDSIDEIERRRK